MFPLHVVGKLASIMSISFRLFGNIFGGYMISDIYFSTIQGSWLYETIGLVTGINMLISVFSVYLKDYYKHLSLPCSH